MDPQTETGPAGEGGMADGWLHYSTRRKNTLTNKGSSLQANSIWEIPCLIFLIYVTRAEVRLKLMWLDWVHLLIWGGGANLGFPVRWRNSLKGFRRARKQKADLMDEKLAFFFLSSHWCNSLEFGKRSLYPFSFLFCTGYTRQSSSPVLIAQVRWRKEKIQGVACGHEQTLLFRANHIEGKLLVVCRGLAHSDNWLLFLLFLISMFINSGFNPKRMLLIWPPTIIL